MNKPYRCFKFLVFLLTFFCRLGFGAACCGGSSVLPSLISGDDRAQFDLSMSHANVVADALAGGKTTYRNNQDNESRQTAQFAGALLLSDRWQIGSTFGLVRRERSTSSFSSHTFGLNDIKLHVAYEILPDWDYSPWRPKGFLYFRLSLPTGGNRFESNQRYTLDVRGTGFYSTTLGVLFSKALGDFDFSLIGENQYSFSRSFTIPSGKLDVNPGFRWTGNLGVGWSPGAGRFRTGLDVGAFYEEAQKISGSMIFSTEPQLLWDMSVKLSYLWDNEWSTTLTYTDQTLLSEASNSSLSRILAFSIQKRFER